MLTSNEEYLKLVKFVVVGAALLELPALAEEHEALELLSVAPECLVLAVESVTPVQLLEGTQEVPVELPAVLVLQCVAPAGPLVVQTVALAGTLVMQSVGPAGPLVV